MTTNTDDTTDEVTTDEKAFERRAAMPAWFREGDFLHQRDPWAGDRASSWVVDDLRRGPRYSVRYRLVRTDEGGRGDVITRTHAEVMSWVGEGAVEYEHQVGDPADDEWECGP